MNDSDIHALQLAMETAISDAQPTLRLSRPCGDGMGVRRQNVRRRRKAANMTTDRPYYEDHTPLRTVLYYIMAILMGVIICAGAVAEINQTYTCKERVTHG